MWDRRRHERGQRRPPRAHHETWRSRLASRTVRRALRGRAVAVLAATAVLWVNVTALGDVRRRENELGVLTEVVVATEDLPAGTLLEDSSVRLERWPIGFVPDGTLSSLPSGARVRVDVVAGEPLHSSRLGDSSSPTAARLGPTRGAVLLPAGPGIAAASEGDVVDVYASAFGSGADGPPRPGAARVASAAEVLEVNGHGAVIAVDRSEIAGTMAAAMAPGAGLVVLGSGSSTGDGDVVDDE